MPMLTPDGLAGLIFIFLAAVTLAGAFIAATALRLPRAVAGLALGFCGLAGIFYFLNSPFVALMELLIYVGAVCVAIVFAIMLADPGVEKARTARATAIPAALSLPVGALFAWGLIILAKNTMWPAPAAKLNPGDTVDIGHSLLTTYSMVFELISIVLLMAIIGALVLARKGRD